MAVQGINWFLVAFQLFNIGLAVVWIWLMLRALGRLDAAPLSESQRLVWAVMIVMVPIMGAVAFLAAYPAKNAKGKTQDAK